MWTLFTILGLAVLISAAIAGVSAAPWLPTKAKDRRHLLNSLDLKPEQKVIDLGSGDGSLLFALARRFPQTYYIGYEISLLPLLISWLRKIIFFQAYKNVSLRFGNLFKQTTKEADVVFIFLLAKSYPRLVEKLQSELKDEAVVIVEAWPLPNIEPSKALKEPGCLSLYFYTGKRLRGVE